MTPPALAMPSAGDSEERLHLMARLAATPRKRSPLAAEQPESGGFGYGLPPETQLRIIEQLRRVLPAGERGKGVAWR